MTPFDQELSARLAAIRASGLHRELRCVDSAQSPRITVAGQTLLNFSSNDYLGLANEPALREAAIHAVERYGAGCGASRLVCGSLRPHHHLETTLADFKGAEAALSFSSGYTAALGTVAALLGKGDFIILDRLVHACIVDAAKLSGAKLRVFAHNDLDDLESKLQWADNAKTGSGQGKTAILVITESIFSMDGDAAPLREIVALKEKYGAWLMVDEAHATGLLGQHGRGLADALGVSGQVEIHLGTLGKALGASGGYICGRRVLIDYLINRARSFIFSTAPVPAAAAAASAGIRIVQSAEGEARRKNLFARIGTFTAHLKAQTAKLPSAIVPLILGDENNTLAAAAHLRAQNIFVPAIRYPTVARGAARLRLTFSAAHTEADVAELVTALRQLSLLNSI